MDQAEAEEPPETAQRDGWRLWDVFEQFVRLCHREQHVASCVPRPRWGPNGSRRGVHGGYLDQIRLDDGLYTCMYDPYTRSLYTCIYGPYTHSLYTCTYDPYTRFVVVSPPLIITTATMCPCRNVLPCKREVVHTTDHTLRASQRTALQCGAVVAAWWSVGSDDI